MHLYCPHFIYYCVYISPFFLLQRSPCGVCQWSPTPGPQTGTGPWIKWYRAAQGTLNYFSLHAVAALGLGLPHAVAPPQRATVKLSNVDRSAAIKRLGSTALDHAPGSIWVLMHNSSLYFICGAFMLLSVKSIVLAKCPCFVFS